MEISDFTVKELRLLAGLIIDDLTLNWANKYKYRLNKLEKITFLLMKKDFLFKHLYIEDLELIHDQQKQKTDGRLFTLSTLFTYNWKEDIPDSVIKYYDTIKSINLEDYETPDWF